MNDTLRQLAAGLRSSLESQVTQSQLLDDPVRWSNENLGIELWRKQQMIVDSVKRYQETYVPSCFGSGKSLTAAVLACWWVSKYRENGIVVITAPTTHQVESILWQEIQRLNAQAKIKLPGEIFAKDWKIDNRLVAFGRAPQDYRPETFQGIHRENILVILDEAAGIKSIMWEAVEGLLTSAHARLLAIGNPIEPSGRFYQGCLPGPFRNTIKISAFDSPNLDEITLTPIPSDELARDVWKRTLVQNLTNVVNAGPPKIPQLVTATWVRRQIMRFPLEHPFIESKVFGDFPKSGAQSIIPYAFLMPREEETTFTESYEKYIMGVDPARFGDCETAIVVRKANKIQVIRGLVGLDGPSILTTMKEIIASLGGYGAFERICIDEPGVGGYLIDWSRKDPNLKPLIVAVNTGRRAVAKMRYANLRAELWWHVREALDPTVSLQPLKLIYDDTLIEQLGAPRYNYKMNRVGVETKEELRTRGVNDLGRADALVLTYYTGNGIGGRITASDGVAKQRLDRMYASVRGR